MVEANVKIIEYLKDFLDLVVSEKDIRELFVQKAGDFSRERKLSMDRVIGIIINLPKRSLSIEMQEFFDIVQENSCTKGAFSQQRVKLSPLFFKLWNKFLVDSFYHYYGDEIKRWHGFRLLAVDGSTAYLFNKQQVLNHFGTQDNKHVKLPMARVLQIYDVLNGITVWGDIYPIIKSEQAIVADQIERLSPDTLTLFDRAFPSYALMYRLLNQEEPRHFVMRCKVGFNEEVKAFMRSSKKSKIVELKAGYTGIASLRQYGFIVTSATTIKIRMVKIKLSTNETEVLLTSLLDEKLYPVAALKLLYGMRWPIETSYDKQKNQQQMEQFSGQTVISIEQDYLAGIFVGNLQSLIEKQSNTYLKQINKQRKYDYKINTNISWGSMKHRIVKLFLFKDAASVLLHLQKLFEKNLEPVRPGRHYKRINKTKRLNGKYQTFTNYKRAI